MLPLSGRTGHVRYKPAKVDGRDDMTGKALVLRPGLPQISGVGLVDVVRDSAFAALR